MKDLANLAPPKGSNPKSRRIGRGIGSGLGKTAGKGHKGQKARKGSGPARGFEGGQTPLYRRLPKYGFSRNGKQAEYQLVKLSALEVFADGDTVSKEDLFARGLIKSPRKQVKILADASLSKKLTVSVEKASRKAREAVETLGGTIQGVR